MKRFQSRYHQIHKLHLQYERLAKNELASRSAAVADALLQEQYAQRVLSELQQQAAAELQGNVTVVMVSSALAAVAQAEQSVRNAQAERQSSEVQMDESLRSYRAVRMELRKVESLMHAEQSQHRRQQLNLEERKQEERSTGVWYRSQMAPESSVVRQMEDLNPLLSQSQADEL